MIMSLASPTFHQREKIQPAPHENNFIFMTMWYPVIQYIVLMRITLAITQVVSPSDFLIFPHFHVYTILSPLSLTILLLFPWSFTIPPPLAPEFHSTLFSTRFTIPS